MSRIPRGLRAVAAVALTLVVGFGYLWMRRPPAVVDLATAVAGVASAQDAVVSGPATTASTLEGPRPEPSASSTTISQLAAAEAAVPLPDLSGRWWINTELGEYSLENPTSSFVGVRIQEELARIGAAVAVARTDTVFGSITIDGTRVVEAGFEVEMGTLASDDHHRDEHMYDAIEIGAYPVATFVLTDPVELGANVAAGEAVTLDVHGTLTIHGVTRDVSIELEAQLVEDVVVIVGSFDISFSDYGVEAPTSRVALSVDDVGSVELQLLLTREV